MKSLWGCRPGVVVRSDRPRPRTALLFWYCSLALALVGASQTRAAGSAPSFRELAGPGQSLVEERSGEIAAALPSGQILVAGGVGRSGTLSSAELFDPATLTFSKLTRSLTEPRWDPVAATLPSGQVLIAGGEVNQGPVRSAELFDPRTDTFSELTGPGESLTQARYGAIAVTLPSGEVLIAGGSESGELELFLTSAELFNPTTDTFTKLTGSGQSMVEARFWASAAKLPNGDALIVGGRNGHGGQGQRLASAELFDPATDTFSELTGPEQSLAEARSQAVAASLPSGQVLIAGGEGQSGKLSSAEIFNPTTETFEATSSTAVARTRAAAASLASGEVLIAGGEGSAQTAELFSPSGPLTPSFTIEIEQKFAGQSSYTKSKLKTIQGPTVDYRVLVTNTGSVELSLGPLTDPECEHISPSAGTQLAIGASQEYTCEHMAFGIYRNVASIANAGEAPEQSNEVEMEAQPLPEELGAGCRARERSIRLHGVGGAQRKPFNAWVSSRWIKAITFYIDGSKLKSLQGPQASRGRFTVTVNPDRLSPGAHTVSITATLSRPNCASFSRSATFRVPARAVETKPIAATVRPH